MAASFEFLGPYFITEVFLYLDDDSGSVFDNVFVEDEGFYELSSEEQKEIWAVSSKPIEVEEFWQLLERYKKALRNEPSSAFQFRTSPSQHAARIDEALEFIERHRGRSFRLSICFLDGYE